MFWKSMFFPNISDDIFEKMYAYQIRHNYGQEGNQKDYRPASCANILMNFPMLNDCHGCPFRISKSHTLVKQICALEILEVSSKSIVDVAKSGNYQLACAQVFDLVFGRVPKFEIVEHPNVYYLEAKMATQSQK